MVVWSVSETCAIRLTLADRRCYYYRASVRLIIMSNTYPVENKSETKSTCQPPSTVRIQVKLFEPDENRYPVFNYQKLLLEEVSDAIAEYMFAMYTHMPTYIYVYSMFVVMYICVCCVHKSFYRTIMNAIPYPEARSDRAFGCSLAIIYFFPIFGTIKVGGVRVASLERFEICTIRGYLLLCSLKVLVGSFSFFLFFL